MAKKERKRMIAGGLYDPNSAAYWEAMLRKEGLGMGVGSTSKLSYAGTGARLEYIEWVEAHSSGRVEPKKGLD